MVWLAAHFVAVSKPFTSLSLRAFALPFLCWEYHSQVIYMAPLAPWAPNLCLCHLLRELSLTSMFETHSAPNPHFCSKVISHIQLAGFITGPSTLESKFHETRDFCLFCSQPYLQVPEQSLFECIKCHINPMKIPRIVGAGTEHKRGAGGGARGCNSSSPLGPAGETLGSRHTQREVSHSSRCCLVGTRAQGTRASEHFTEKGTSHLKSVINQVKSLTPRSRELVCGLYLITNSQVSRADGPWPGCGR